MRIIVCGSREWTDEDVIKRLLKEFSPDVVIEGECRGADLLAKKCANELGIRVEPYPANWDRYGRGAGPIRNKQMIVEGKPDLVVAFHNDIKNSLGTKNMLWQAKSYGIPTNLISTEV